MEINLQKQYTIYAYWNKLIVLSCILLCGFYNIKAQDVSFENDFDFYFDNREFFTSYAPHYTIFGARTTPSVVLRTNDMHTLKLGFSLSKNFGEHLQNQKPIYVGEYSYTGDLTKVNLGIIPRKKLTMHRFLLNDTLAYSRPFLQGMLIKTSFGNLEQEVWIDWLSKQTDTIPESFMIGNTGKWNSGPVIFQHQLLIVHDALPGKPGPEDHIHDNIGGIIQAGYTFKKSALWDTLLVSAGSMFSFDRLRSVYDWNTPIGLYLAADYKKSNIGMNISYYGGKKQKMLYGDRFYTAGNYLRTDFIYTLFSKDFIQAEIKFTLHMLPEGTDFAQAFNLVYTFKN